MSHPVQTLLRTEKKKEKTKTQTKKSQIKSTSPTLQRIAPWMNRRERYAKEPSLCCYLSATHHHMICIICIVCKLCDPPIDHLNRAGFAKKWRLRQCTSTPFFDAYIVPHLRGIELSSNRSITPTLGPLAPGPSSPFAQLQRILPSTVSRNPELTFFRVSDPPERGPVARDP